MLRSPLFALSVLFVPALFAQSESPVPRPPLVAAAGDATEPTGPVAAALAAMGIAGSDLGYRPRAHWPRYPHPSETPHVLPFFADLHARPLDTYGFARGFGNAVEDLLTAERLRAPPEGEDRRETLFRLAVALGTDPKGCGFRGYSANLASEVEEHEPLLRACQLLLERSGAPLRREAGSFGGRYEEEAASPLDALRARVDAVPRALHRPLARLLLDLVSAREWIETGLRDVPREMRARVFAALERMGDGTADGLGYEPVLDDVARRIDEDSLYYGCLKALQATQDARRRIARPEGGEWAEFRFRLETPWGTVLFDNRYGNDRVEADPFLVVEFTGQGVFWEPLGATAPDRPLSVALFLEHTGTLGVSAAYDVQREAGTAALASGVLGCGVVYVSGDHANAFRTGRAGLGFGAFGLGALVDEGGTDTYKIASAGQGAGIFGIGLLLDAGGDEEYRLLEGDGQGYGGPGGVGVLADRSGDDRYEVERDAALAGRGDYHSEGAIAFNNAQGAGFGRRGDGSDGHDWGGGLGLLLDVDGDDTYRAGNFTQGIGYWYGTGLLWDGGGNDRYESVYFTQGSGAHFAIGALIDEGGDDLHRLEVTAGAGLGFGWDVVNALLIDRGRGDDRYEADRISIGCAEVRSNAFFLDEGGDDTYLLGAGARGFGDVDVRPGYTSMPRTAVHPYALGQVALFLDLGGKDRYLRRAKDGDGEPFPDDDAADGATWHVRTHPAGALHGPNVSYAADLDAVPPRFLAPWPARAPAPEKDG